MTVYVDDMYLYPMGQFKRMKMSHMIADTDDELHAIADKIGLRREWFQGDHYDVSISVRELAIAAGAIPITLNQLSIMAINRRNGLILGTPTTAPVIRNICRYFRQHRIEIPDQFKRL